jgi:chromosome segregation ATPase
VNRTRPVAVADVVSLLHLLSLPVHVIRRLTAAVVALEGRIASLEAEAVRLRAVGQQIHDGGEDFRRDMNAFHTTAARLERTAAALNADLRQLRRELPDFDELEDRIETVADTMEPLQGAAERVGRISDRFSRSGR